MGYRLLKLGLLGCDFFYREEVDGGLFLRCYFICLLYFEDVRVWGGVV